MGQSRGRFIVMEGLDGSGKSTHVRNLAKRIMEQEGRQVFATAEPTDSVVGGLIREALAGSITRGPEELAALFLADRITHNVGAKNGIEMYLQSGVDVICDRYYYSSMAYQGMDTDFEWVRDMNLRCPLIKRPDMCIFLDLDPAACVEHIHKGRVHFEIYEDSVETIERTRRQFEKTFASLGPEEHIFTVDAARPKDVVDDEIYEIVRGFDFKPD